MLGLGILIAYASSCYAQADNHCIPLDESRIIHRMAHESLMIPELKGKIDLLEKEKEDYRKVFDHMMAIERSKYDQQLSKFDEQVKISASFDQQIKGLQRAERKARRERNIAIGLGAVLIVLAVVK